MNWKRFALPLTAAGILAAVVYAFNPQPDPPGFYSILAVTASQTSRFAAVAISDENDAQACPVQLMYLDPGGNPIKQEIHRLGNGRAVWLDLAGTDVTRSAVRAEIRASAVLLGGPDTKRKCRLATSWQIFDNATGATTVALSQGN